MAAHRDRLVHERLARQVAFFSDASARQAINHYKLDDKVLPRYRSHPGCAENVLLVNLTMSTQNQ